VATKMLRLRREVELRRVWLPMFAALLLGFALGSACYPVVGRPVLLGGPLGSLRRAVLAGHGTPVFAFGLWDTFLSLGFGVLCLTWLAQEQRRTSRTLLLPQSKYYRLALLALGISCVIAWPGRGEVATRISHLAAALAGGAILLAAWPGWRLGRRLQAVVLLAVGCSIAVFVAYQADCWFLRDGGPSSYR
jgi:hypothetical protein